MYLEFEKKTTKHTKLRVRLLHIMYRYVYVCMCVCECLWLGEINRNKYYVCIGMLANKYMFVFFN